MTVAGVGRGGWRRLHRRLEVRSVLSNDFARAEETLTKVASG